MLRDATRTGLSPAAARLSRRFRSRRSCNGAVLLPRGCLDSHGLGSSPFARHYWGNHCYFLFLRVLRCFSSPRWPHYRIIVIVTKGDWVVPFGDRGIKGRLRLPRDYRSLPRPSSPPGAKASAMRPFLLSYFSRSALPPGKNGGKRAHTSSSRCMVSFSLAIRLL